MMRIHKFILTITDLQQLLLPERAEILSVAEQRGTLCLWALVDPAMIRENDKASRTIQIIGTGNPIAEHPGRFIGTVVMDPFVWHVFERL